MAKTKPVSFRFSQQMMRHLEELAKAAGVTVAEYIRRLVARELLK